MEKKNTTTISLLLFSFHIYYLVSYLIQLKFVFLIYVVNNTPPKKKMTPKHNYILRIV